MNKEEKRDLMLEIKEEILQNSKLPLYKERKKNKVFPVIGEGSHSAKIMFIGEAPGKNEAATGRPFCGASGKFLDKLLAHAGIKRDDVYITNIVKDRPPANRDPFPDEIEAYAPYLDRQIDIIRPKIIATLGRFSMVYIMEKFGLEDRLDAISKIHGRSFEAKAPFGKIIITPLYHPAVAIYNPHAQEELKKDFLVLKKFAD
ncbi:MAG: uracil-DNA glycosylase [Patescibacteria group bacterium]|nr:uracil-DNA glycosylase [Patescibacteria group bacterium]